MLPAAGDVELQVANARRPPREAAEGEAAADVCRLKTPRSVTNRCEGWGRRQPKSPECAVSAGCEKAETRG